MGQGQEIRGTVRSSTGEPIEGVNIVLLKDRMATEYGSVSDPEGRYVVTNIATGRYQLVASHVNYKPQIIEEVLVNASRQLVFDLTLIEAQVQLEEVVVDATQIPNDFDGIGKKEISMEQTLRYAANFFDPARLSTSYSNVIAADDQANNLVIRGNTPNNMTWMLEGVNVVNPNHLTGAGTFSDRPTQNGGGVNILSSQMLGDVQFLKGTYDVSQGNSLAGIMNMSFRNGNAETSELVAQVSLIGLEFAAEGPIGDKGISYLFNYRYSTVGLLSLMGVDFGGEAIGFQDLAFKFNFPVGKGSIGLFGMGGLSENEFTGQRDSSMWKIQKDRRDINYMGKMGAAGLTYKTTVGKKSTLNAVVAYSAKQDGREAFFIDDLYQTTRESYDTLSNSLLSSKIHFSTNIGREKTLEIGAYADQVQDEVRSVELVRSNPIPFAIGSLEGWIFQPFVNFTDQLSSRLNYSVGLRYNYTSWNKDASIEPRALVAYHLSDRHSIYARYGLHSIRQNVNNLFAVSSDPGGSPITPNTRLTFSKSHNYVLGHTATLNTLSITSELYLQNLYDIPIELGNSSYSVLNQLEENTPRVMYNGGTGQNYGIDIEARRSYQNNLYYLIGGSLYNSTYVAGDGIKRDSRYNGGYTFHFTGGKEFRRSISDGERTFEVNLKVLYLGGFRDTPIDEFESEVFGRTRYFEDQAYSIKLNDYFRLDARVAWTKNKVNYTRIISIDIQNLFSIENDAYNYYDTFKNTTVLRTQLGIIPVITYRVEF